MIVQKTSPISEKIQQQIRDGLGNASLSVMSEPFKTGGILIFNAKTVEVYGNQVIKYDYGICVMNYQNRTENVALYDNHVEKSHRSFFISVYCSDDVDIYDSSVIDNGLHLFMDNEALKEAFNKGENYGNGRSQGILCDGCKVQKIHDNVVIGSSSDGIGVTRGDLEYTENIEISNNEVRLNSEQGIWLVCVNNGTINGNMVHENRSASDLTGGSSGINFEGGVSGFRVFDNDIAYNDMFGIMSLDSWDNQYYNNTIHHNGDGAMCWGDCEHEVETGYGKDIVFDNYIHDNRGSVFALWSDDTLELEIYGNTFLRNGGNPIHFEQYANHEIKAHPEDWDYNGPSVFLPIEQADRLRFLSIGKNIIDGVPVTGSFTTGTSVSDHSLSGDNPGNSQLLILLLVVVVLAVGIVPPASL